MPLLTITTPNQKGELKVNLGKNLKTTPHSDLDGLINKTGKDLRVSIQATGKWRLYNQPSTDPKVAPFCQETGPEGYTKLDPTTYLHYNFIYSGRPAGCLMAQVYTPDGKPPQYTSFNNNLNMAERLHSMNYTGELQGANYVVQLQPGYYIAFGINDDPKFFADNTGNLTIIYTSAPYVW